MTEERLHEFRKSFLCNVSTGGVHVDHGAVKSQIASPHAHGSLYADSAVFGAGWSIEYDSQITPNFLEATLTLGHQFCTPEFRCGSQLWIHSSYHSAVRGMERAKSLPGVASEASEALASSGEARGS
jgi:hypothetical protein